jgi:2-polyprenyl-3-methyl-5-hydroxy-6-metoxy-1,4-benzoquinol methylase
MLACPVCQHKTWSKSLTVRSVSLSSCGDCGLLATTSFLGSNQSVDPLYDVSEDDRKIYEADYLHSRLVSFGKVLPRLEKYRHSLRLLEIGSGYGDFLRLAVEAKWDAEGVEISKYACAVARQRGCKVHDVPIDQLDLPKDSFDVVIMWDVIEHFERPQHIIDACARLLRVGGALVMKTPDARALALSGGLIRKLYQQLVYPANTAEHIFHFTPEALERMLMLFGFGVVSVDDRDDWNEKVISGRTKLIRKIRFAIMSYAHARSWPYEFVVTAVKE